MFAKRSRQPERIDTGDYTPEEYERFLQDIRLVNRFAGDNRALSRTLLRRIRRENLKRFSVLDVGAGSGELLRTVASFARRESRQAELVGLEINKRSARAILEESAGFGSIRAVRGDALRLPFAGDSFDFVISSLFTHHLTDEKIIRTLTEMARVARRQVLVIDLHRHRAAYLSYKIFCTAFRLSPLVRQDGSLSIRRGFKGEELQRLAEKARLKNISVKRHFPYRLVLRGN